MIENILPAFENFSIFFHVKGGGESNLQNNDLINSCGFLDQVPVGQSKLFI